MHNNGTSNRNGTMVTKEKIPPDDNVDVGLIIGLISLILLLIIMVIVIYYFAKAKKRKQKNSGDILRNESKASDIGVVNEVCEEEGVSANPTPSPSEKSLNSNEIKINIVPENPPHSDRTDSSHRKKHTSRKHRRRCDETLDVFLNNVESSVIASKDTIDNHHEILQKVKSVRSNTGSENRCNDKTLLELLRTIEHTSLSGLTDLTEILKCDGQTRTKVVDENSPSNKTLTKDDPGELSFVRSISEIENGGLSNGVRDSSYFNVEGRHSEQY